MERKRARRKVPEFVYERIRSTIPKSFELYCYLKAKIRLNSVEEFIIVYKVSVNIEVFSICHCFRVINLWAFTRLTQIHVANHCEFKLSKDIEQNTYPTSGTRVYRRAFESLISEDYKNFILTAGCIGVAILLQWWYGI